MSKNENLEIIKDLGKGVFDAKKLQIQDGENRIKDILGDALISEDFSSISQEKIIEKFNEGAQDALQERYAELAISSAPTLEEILKGPSQTREFSDREKQEDY